MSRVIWGNTMRRIGLGVILFGLAACSSPEEMGEDVGVADTQSGQNVEEIAEAIGVVDAEPLVFNDDASDGEAERTFSYKWPAQVSAIETLVQRLGAERDQALSEQVTEWQSALEEFGTEGCISCVNRGFGKEWKVVTDTPRFLSLSADTYVYSGGAHGNSYFDALVWDREGADGAGEALRSFEMFSSDEALSEAIRAPYCASLDAERAKRRGAPVEPGGFGSECPELAELVLILGSSNGETFDRLGLLAAPYVAGAYAEGPYEVTLPVTQAVIDAVKPAFKDHFSVQ